MKYQYPQVKNVNEQQKEWIEANNSTKINKNSTKNINQSHLEINFSQFSPSHLNSKKMMRTIDPQINNLATQNIRRPSL